MALKHLHVGPGGEFAMVECKCVPGLDLDFCYQR